MRKVMVRCFLLIFMTLAFSVSSFAQVRVSVGFGPPALLAYEQPICPGEGYIWTPGYWAWDADEGGNYYWVDGSWEMSPEVGFLWTPGYWGWGGDGFFFNEGYWGSQVGFYGGINYGFGYGGEGYEGGRWDNGRFFYNSSVNNINITVNRNVYNERITNTNESRVSFNGGNGGITARPSTRDDAASHERHVAPVAAQTQHAVTARSNPASRAPANHNEQPASSPRSSGATDERTAAPANMNDAKGRPEANTPPKTAFHPNDLPAYERTTPNTGNPKLDQKYQKQQDQLAAKQGQERQKVQQQQEQDHQRMTQQKANDSTKQQVEQKHQQQTQQLAQKHTQQQQSLQTRQQPQQQHQSAPPKPHQ